MTLVTKYLINLVPVISKYCIIPLFPAGPFVDIFIRSEGCDDPGKAPGTCGIAYIKVNGEEHSPHGRGHNVVFVDAKTGNVITKHKNYSCNHIIGTAIEQTNLSKIIQVYFY